MTDDQIEKLVWRELRKRKVLYYDMIGMPHCGVDPNPEDKITPPCEKGIRSNRFQSYMGCDRMKELLSVGKYDEWHDPPLKVPFQELFRFWWNRCVSQEKVADEILEDIYDYFTARMLPPQQEEPQMDLTIDFHQMPLFIENTETSIPAATRAA